MTNVVRAKLRAGGDLKRAMLAAKLTQQERYRAAVAACRSHRLSEKQASTMYGVPRTNLLRRLKRPSGEVGARGRPPILDSLAESIILKVFVDFANQNLPLPRLLRTYLLLHKQWRRPRDLLRSKATKNGAGDSAIVIVTLLSGHPAPLQLCASKH